MRIAYCDPNTLTSPTPLIRDKSSWMFVASQSDNVDVGVLVRRIIDADNHQEVWRALGDRDALLLNRLREPGHRRLNLILDLDLRDVGIDALVEHGLNRDLSARTR